MRLIRVLATLSGAALLALALSSVAYGAKPVTVQCGQTITKDTTLANDLTDCPGVGIVIGAADITLDLNGHTVDGDGVADFEGIQNLGHDRVTIKGGTISDFVEGAAVIDARDNRLRDLTTRRQRHSGIFVGGGRDTEIERNSTSDRCAGVTVTRSRRVSIKHNLVAGGLCSGIPVFESSYVSVVDNSVSRMGDASILLVRDSDNNRVERNSVSDGQVDGIVIDEDADHNVVSRNLVQRNGGAGAVLFGTTHNRVTSNTLRDNAFGGLVLIGSDDNLVEQNSISGNGVTADAPDGGIHVLVFPDDPETISNRNSIARNYLIGNNPDGILVDTGNTRTLIDGNFATANLDDGIDVDSPSTTLTRNSANRNHDLGIEAVPGVTDGGGNRASGNGNPLQCTNIFCKGG